VYILFSQAGGSARLSQACLSGEWVSHGGEKKPGLVPFPRFFAVFGYAVFCCVALFILAEAASRVALPVYDHIKHPLVKAGPQFKNLLSQRRGAGKWGGWFFADQWVDVNSASPAYSGYAWAEDFWKEQRRLFESENSAPSPYEPFRVWGLKESHGKYFNVDKTGMGTLRRTANPVQPGCQGRPARKVWVFGGSTVYGYGVPDFATLPSYLSQKLNAGSGNCVEVFNLGVDGYNTNQEVVYLTQNLKAGGRPDAVVFYDGFNDAYVGAIEPGNPAAHWFYKEVRARQQNTVINWPTLFKKSYFLAIMGRLSARLHPRPPVPSGQDSAARVRGTLDNYESNLRLARLLAGAYGFQVYFFWQPYVLYGNKPLVPFERSLDEDKEFYAVYKEADRRATATGNFIFLGRIFDQVKEPLYIDTVHLGPRGDEIVAGAVAAKIQPDLANGTAQPGEAPKGKAR
jgi:lysophospholipase L1-like esterase